MLLLLLLLCPLLLLLPLLFSAPQKCKKEKKKDFVDCKTEVLGPPVCKKVCECDHPINKLFGHMGKGKGH